MLLAEDASEDCIIELRVVIGWVGEEASGGDDIVDFFGALIYLSVLKKSERKSKKTKKNEIFDFFFSARFW